MKIQKIGMRNVKTGTSAMICAVLAQIHLIQNPFFAIVACVVSTQNTVKGSLNAGFNRLKGTILGGFVGFILALLIPSNSLIVGVGIIITIYLCSLTKLTSSVVISCVVYTSIYLGVGADNAFNYSIFRVIDTSFGVIISLIINYLFSRPDYKESIHTKFKSIEDKVINLVKLKIIDNKQADIISLEKELIKLEDTYNKFIEELRYKKEEESSYKIKNTLNMCKEIFYHLKSIEFLKKKCYLSTENYNGLIRLYGNFETLMEIDDEISPVFNYHLKMIIKEIDMLHKINELTE